MATKDATVYKLNNDIQIPGVGLGTWQSKDQEVYDAVKTALKAGYKHIDTAWIYGNEEPVGRAIKDSGVDRKDIFVTTKLWATYHRTPEKNLDDSLKKLQLDYVDLYLMHWPIPFNPDAEDKTFPKKSDGSSDIDEDWTFIKTWEQMQKLPKEKVRAIGVSNFSSKQLEELLNASTTTVTPAANQVETHPYLPQKKLIDYCKSKGIIVQAYSPLGSTNSGLLEDNIIKRLADKYGVSGGQILISWALWRGTVVLPKSVTPHRVISNFETVQLTDQDGETINDIKTRKRFISPPWYDGKNLFHDGEE